jgi:hypothetical protein
METSDSPINEAQRVADQVRISLPHVKSGTLRFWGEWFGRPHDNYHRIVGCECEENLLKLHLNEGETLSACSPVGVIVSPTKFKIAKAERVRWEWFYYRRPKVAANLYFEEFVNSPDGIAASTSADWYKAEFGASRSKPAVEIL